MKAQARKILALIMAMVMSLSLAAPAFAEAEEAAEASTPAPEAVEVVETEAPEAEEEEEEPEVEAQETKAEKKSALKAQSEIDVNCSASGHVSDGWKLTYNDVSGTFTISDGTDVKASGDVNKKTQANAAVKVTPKYPDIGLIGQDSLVPEYTVEFNTHKFEGIKVGTATTPKTVKDITDWKELSGAATVIDLGAGKYGQVKGYVYEEKLASGASNAYFKLYDGNSTNTEFTNDELYFVATSVAALSTDSDVQSALAKAKLCNDSGSYDPAQPTNNTVVQEKAYVEVESTPTLTTTYAYTVINQVDVAVSATSGTVTDTTSSLTAITFTDADKTTGTFDVSIQNQTGDKTKWYYLSNADEIKTLIEKAIKNVGIGASVESVTAKSGNYWTVTVKEVQGAKPVDGGVSKNIISYFTGTASARKYTAILINDTKDGFYNADNDKGANGKTISAGTVATGHVAVRMVDVSAAAKTIDDGTGKANSLKNLKDKVAAGKANVYDSTGMLVPAGTVAGWTVTSNTAYNNFDTVVFNSLDDAQGVFVVDECKQGTTIPYAELKMNPIVNGKVNPFVQIDTDIFTDTGNGVFDITADYSSAVGSPTAASTMGLTYLTTYADTAVPFAMNWTSTSTDSLAVVAPIEPGDGTNKNWFADAYVSSNAAYVNKGTITVDAAKHGAIVARVDRVEPTCGAAGSETTTNACSICGTVIGTPVVKELPAITDPVEENLVADPADPTNTEKKKMIFDEDDLKTPALAPKTKHYLTKAVPTTTVSDDKMTTTTTIEYYCNFGVKHPESTKKYEVKKTELQHSGSWNSVTLEKATEMEVLNNGGGLFALVKNLIIADSDIDNANIVMNRDTTTITDDFFKVDLSTLGSLGTPGWTYNNGVYTYVADDTATSNFGDAGTTDAFDIDVYATSKGVPTTKHYGAVVKVSDIKEPQHKRAGSASIYCDDGSFVVSATVYEIKDNAKGVTGTAYMAALTDANLAENLQKGKVVVVNDSYKETVTLTGTGHKFFNDDGQATELCTWCGTKKPTETVIANAIDPANVTVKDLTYTGKAAQPKVKVKDNDGFALILGTDYVVSEVDETDVGEYSITIKGINDYAGNKFQKTFKITQAAQPMKLSATTVNAKVKDVKKKAKTYALKVTKAQGKVTVKSNKKNVSWKSNKVTVKKGTKKMTAKLTFKAAGNANYKSGSKTAKVVIK